MSTIINKLFKYNDKISTIALEVVKVLALTLGLAIISQLQLYIYIVPLTLQTSYVALVGLVAPKRTSIYYLTLYIIFALSGAPVLTGMQGLNKNNIFDFGFVIGFLVMAWLINYLWNKVKKQNFLSLISIIIIANITLYAIGFGWVLLLGNKMSFSIMLPFIIFDTLKMTAVISLYNIITNKRLK